VYIRYFWQKNHHIYGHIRCVYTVLANPSYIAIYASGGHLSGAASERSVAQGRYIRQAEVGNKLARSKVTTEGNTYSTGQKGDHKI